MAKVLALSLLMLTSCVIAVRDRSQSLDLNDENGPEDDARCNAACPGTHASRFGSILGGLKECTCEDASQIIANQHGEVRWAKDYLDNNYNSFEYEKKGWFRDSKCMPRKERVWRQALVDFAEALKFKKDATSNWQFLGVSLHAQALATFADATRGERRETLSTDVYLRGFDCSGRKFQTPELDAACADGMVAIKQFYQSEAAGCLDAVQGLERVKEFIDGAAFTKAAALVSEAVRIMKENNSRDDAKDKAGEARAALLGIVQGLVPKVEESIPPF